MAENETVSQIDPDKQMLVDQFKKLVPGIVALLLATGLIYLYDRKDR